MSKLRLIMKTGLTTMCWLAAAILAAGPAVSCGHGGPGRQVDAAAVQDEVPEEPSADRTFAPGETVPDTFLVTYEKFFTVQPVPDGIFDLMQGKTYKQGCTVPREDLRYILCLHKDKEGRSIVGEMVADRQIAESLKDIFLKLYEASYPIEKMRLPDYWDADDELMMRDNNSSCFNFRTVPATGKMSKHALGLAVDINPLYNPYVRKKADGTFRISPETAGEYVDRTADFDYKIVRGDLCWKSFTENGFKWGGSWNSMKDYQHFEFSASK